MSSSEPKFKFFKTLLENPPSVLYHYTSMVGLLGIGRSGKIYASDSRYLNDITDSAYVFEFLKDFVDQQVAGTTGEDKKYYQELGSALRTTRMAEVFVASFSEDGDSLSQWRAYSSGGVGFSIGFDAKSLIAAHVSDPTTGKPFSVISQLRKVEYLTSAGEASDELLNEAKRLGNAMVWASRQKEEPDATEQPISSAATAALLAILAPIFKHHAFNEEREWRLVLAEVLDQMPSKQFRMGRSTLVPYVEVEPHLKEGYFVKEVIVGPTPHPELSIAALRAFFQSLNHPEVTLHASKVPYRHW